MRRTISRSNRCSKRRVGEGGRGGKIAIGKTEFKMKKQSLWRRAIRVIPGGVNSPVRAFRAVKGVPFFVASARGSRLRTSEGGSLLDYVCSWGPLILGHSHPVVLAAVEDSLRRGTTYGAPTEREVRFAELITHAFPSVGKVRLTSSGTEAAMSAIRLARGYTGRDRIVKFAGCYHGHTDSLLVSAGSGAATFGVPDSAGVTAACARDTIVLPYNDTGAVTRIMERHGDSIACIIVEPVAGNMGVIPPMGGFLQTLRKLTASCGSLLIFDEVITGFRLGWGGAQALHGITPDMTVLGKIIGGGLPIGAFGGRRDIMDLLAPDGPVYQAGTLSGNPLAVAAGLAALTILKKGTLYQKLEEKSAHLAEGLMKACRQAKIPAFLSRAGSMFTLFFNDGEVRDFNSAKRSDVGRYAKFFHAMLIRGVYFPPSQFESCFLSIAHTERDIDLTIAAAEEACRTI